MTLGEFIKQYREEHGLSVRYFASLADMSPQQIINIAKNQLGHSSIMVTKDIYTHIREKKAGSAVADKLNAYLEGKKKKGE